MKKFCITLFCLSIITLTIVLGASRPQAKEEYLRIHIRARSNSAEDQAVKYAVRDEVVSYLTPIVAECESKAELEERLEDSLGGIEALCDRVLSHRGFDYTAAATVNTEKFPTRIYGELTLEEGYYDALIIELGGGEGDNWWCVVYPPLCFIGEEGEGLRYKWKILEMIEVWKEKHPS